MCRNGWAVQLHDLMCCHVTVLLKQTLPCTFTHSSFIMNKTNQDISPSSTAADYS